MFVCPFISVPLSAALGNGSNNSQAAFYLGAGISLALGAGALLRALRQGRGPQF